MAAGSEIQRMRFGKKTEKKSTSSVMTGAYNYIVNRKKPFPDVQKLQ